MCNTRISITGVEKEHDFRINRQNEVSTGYEHKLYDFFFLLTLSHRWLWTRRKSWSRARVCRAPTRFSNTCSRSCRTTLKNTSLRRRSHMYLYTRWPARVHAYAYPLHTTQHGLDVDPPPGIYRSSPVLRPTVVVTPTGRRPLPRGPDTRGGNDDEIAYWVFITLVVMQHTVE